MSDGGEKGNGSAAQAGSGAAVRHAAIVGAGLIGRSWAIVFSRAGVSVTLYDPDAKAGEAARGHIRSALRELAGQGLVNDPDDAFARISFSGDLEKAVANADWIQECAPEDLDSKIRLFGALDEAAPPHATIASSTSGLRASSFTSEIAGRARMLVAHPVNPPHLAPLVEIAPAPWTSPEVARKAFAFMEAVQQKPIMVLKEIDGFILNRIQGAVLDEAFKLVEEGYVSVADVDRVMVYGLAPRWSFMGPFETIDLNAPGGVSDYASRYGAMYHGFARQRSNEARPWAGEAIRAVEQDRRSRLPLDEIGSRSAWRDRNLMQLAVRRMQPDGAGDGE